MSLEWVKNTGPTLGLDIKNFKKGNTEMSVWDIGG